MDLAKALAIVTSEVDYDADELHDALHVVRRLRANIEAEAKRVADIEADERFLAALDAILEQRK